MASLTPHRCWPRLVRCDAAASDKNVRRRLSVSCRVAPPPRLCSSRKRRLQLMLQPPRIAADLNSISSTGRRVTATCAAAPAEAPCSSGLQPPNGGAQGLSTWAAGGGGAAVELLRSAAWDVSDLVSDGAKALRLRKTPYSPPEDKLPRAWAQQVDAGEGRQLEQLYETVKRINALELGLQQLSDAELQAKTPCFKDRLAAGESLDALMPEAFAVVREASRRVLGMRHFDVQLVGGIVLHQGRVAEMKTGEGKTLVATLPAYLHGLTGKGVHIVTVNDYLAERDAAWIGKVFSWLGLTVAAVTIDDRRDGGSAARREKYAADITYVTGQELAFQYLFDNSDVCRSPAEQVLMRPFYYAIIDEVDSILIDDCRNPLRVTSTLRQPMWRYPLAAEAARRVAAAGVKVDLRSWTVELLPQGAAQAANALRDHLWRQREAERLGREIEQLLDEQDSTVAAPSHTSGASSASAAEAGKRPSLAALQAQRREMLRPMAAPPPAPPDYEPAGSELWAYDQPWGPFVVTALKARFILIRDQEYIVRDGNVEIVDPNTGRVKSGTRWEKGLHNAVEAKEGLELRGTGRTSASTTFQSFFRFYDRLAGMTGTAATEAPEFFEVYGLEVVRLPTNKPSRRTDLGSYLFLTTAAKYDQLLYIVRRAFFKGNGQPVLIGTCDVDESEDISRMLAAEALPHRVLNARPDQMQRESQIIAQAGMPGAITIATNMAGRGTDILLGGNPKGLALSVLEFLLLPSLTNGKHQGEPLTAFPALDSMDAMEKNLPKQLRSALLTAVNVTKARYSGALALDDRMARHILGLVVEEAEVLHARVMTAAARGADAAAKSSSAATGRASAAGSNGSGSDSSDKHNGSSHGSVGGSTAASDDGNPAAGQTGGGVGRNGSNGSSAEQPQYGRILPHAEKVLADWQDRVEVGPQNPGRAAAQGIDGRPPQPGERYTPLVTINMVVATVHLWLWLEDECRRRAVAVRRDGGLFVVGTYLFESDRVEQQLFGRAGRQGDPGTTVSLYDVMDRRWQQSSQSVTGTVHSLADKWGTVPPWGLRSPIVDRMVVREFRNVVASRWREARDVTREYDQVVAPYRAQTYALRRKLVNSNAMDRARLVGAYMQMAVDDLVAQYIDPRLPPTKWRLTVPWTGSGGPHEHLTEAQLDRATEAAEAELDAAAAALRSLDQASDAQLPKAAAAGGGAVGMLRGGIVARSLAAYDRKTAAQAAVDALYAEANARDEAAENRGLALGPLAAALDAVANPQQDDEFEDPAASGSSSGGGVAKPARASQQLQVEFADHGSQQAAQAALLQYQADKEELRMPTVEVITPLELAELEAALERNAPLPDPTKGATLGIARAAAISAFRAARQAAQRPRLTGRHAHQAARLRDHLGEVLLAAYNTRRVACLSIYARQAAVKHPAENQALWHSFEREALLETLDEAWCELLAQLDGLQAATNIRAFSGRSPVEEYAIETRTAYARLLTGFRRDALAALFRGATRPPSVFGHF